MLDSKFRCNRKAKTCERRDSSLDQRATAAKAERDLRFRARPYREALADAIDWFREGGYPSPIHLPALQKGLCLDGHFPGSTIALVLALLIGAENGCEWDNSIAVGLLLSCEIAIANSSNRSTAPPNGHLP